MAREKLALIHAVASYLQGFGSGHSMVFGEFATQTSDAEWSDIRQSLPGEVILNYYQVTHNPECLKRGVEPLRAQFPISPPENWAHAGYGPKAGVSSFCWATASGMAGIELEDQTLNDGVCYLPSERSVGVNGLNLTGWRTSCEGAIALQMDSPYPWHHNPNLVVYGARSKRHYTPSIDVAAPLAFSGEQLEAVSQFNCQSVLRRLRLVEVRNY